MSRTVQARLKIEPTSWRLLSWRRILARLGLSIRSPILPIHDLTCLVCNQTYLSIYYAGVNNAAKDSVWLHCRGCQTCGDPISYAAKVLGIEPHIAFRQFLVDHKHVKPEIANQIFEVNFSRPVAQQQLFQTFWKSLAKSDLHDNKVIQHLQSRFNLRYETRNDERWQETIGRFVQPAANRHILPGNPANINTKKGLRAVIQANKAVLVVPCCDLPGRYTALWTAGLTKDEVLDIEMLYYSEVPNYERDRRSEHIPAGQILHDPGVACYSAMEGATAFGNHVFAIPDIPTVLQLHAIQFTVSREVLPCVGLHIESRVGTRSTWISLPRSRRVIFVAHRSNLIEIFTQAMLANGSVYYEPDRASIFENINHYRPAEWCNVFHKHALPWQSALKRLLPRIPVQQAEQLVLSLPLEEDTANVYRQSYSRLDRSMERVATNDEIKVIELDGIKVIEKNGQWLEANTFYVMLDAIVRIDTVFHYQVDGRTVYHGRIIHHGKDYPFSIDSQLYESKSWRWVRSALLPEGVAHIQHSLRDTYKAIFTQLAFAFHTPRVINIPKQIGWNEKYKAFCFPKLAIVLGTGELVKIPAGPTACANTIEYIIPLSVRLEPLVQVARGTCFWPLFSAFAASVLAPAILKEPPKVCVTGAACIDMVKQLATGLDMLKLEAENTRHGWPGILDIREQPQIQTVASVEPSDFVITNRRLVGDDQIIRVCEGKTVPLPTTLIPKLFVAYFFDLSRRSFRLKATELSLAESVQQDLKVWLSSNGYTID